MIKADLDIQVEQTMFSIHRSALQQSQVFTDMFAGGDDLGGNDEGCTEDNPIQLSSITAAEFTNLLQPIYNAYVVGFFLF